MKINSFTGRYSTRESYVDYNQMIGRLGARLSHDWQDASQNQYTPYLCVIDYQAWGSKAKMNIGSSHADNSHWFESGKFGQMWNAAIDGMANLQKGSVAVG